MSYPVQPDDPRRAPVRVRPDPGPFWIGAVATAVVAALVALVGILISRWTLSIPILAPSGDGAWGTAHTGEYVLAAACVALVAAGLLYLLMLGAPQAGLFFRWIMALATLVAVVYPFSSGAPLSQKAATAIVNLVLGIAITSLLTGVAARSLRYRTPPVPPSRPGAVPSQRYYDERDYPGGRYPDSRYPAGRDHPRSAPVEYGPGEYPGRAYGDSDATRPLNAPPREPGSWQ